VSSVNTPGFGHGQPPYSPETGLRRLGVAATYRRVALPLVDPVPNGLAQQFIRKYVTAPLAGLAHSAYPTAQNTCDKPSKALTREDWQELTLIRSVWWRQVRDDVRCRLDTRAGFTRCPEEQVPGRLEWLLAAALNANVRQDELRVSRETMAATQERLFDGPIQPQVDGQLDSTENVMEHRKTVG
jgi:hypothetical protein